MSTVCLWGQKMRGTGVCWAIQEVKGLPGRGDLCLVTRWGLHGRVHLSELGYEDFSISAHGTEVQGYNTLFRLPQIHLICSKKDLFLNKKNMMSKENVNPARKCERSCYQFKSPSTLSSWVTSMLSVRFRSSFQLEAVFYGKGGPEGREPEESTPSLSTTATS